MPRSQKRLPRPGNFETAGQQDSRRWVTTGVGFRKQNQQREVLQVEQLAAIIDSAIDAVVTVDERQRVILFNSAAETMFLCPAAEVIGQPIDRVIPQWFQATWSGHPNGFGETQETGRGALAEIHGRRANGEDFPIEASISQIESRGQKLYTAILRDISRRKDLEEALRHVSGRLISVQDEERRRVARELHDGVNQQLAILCIELQQLGQTIPKRQSALHLRIQSLTADAQEISSEIRRLAYRLHPSKLDHLGLLAAVQSMCDELSERQDLKIEFRHSGFPAVLPRNITLCLFRIVQESLHNVIIHSGARKALVVLERTGSEIRLSISDEGRGFDAESATIKAGLGLVSMRERIRLVGGEISIRSQPSRGTQIDVSVPLTRGAMTAT